MRIHGLDLELDDDPPARAAVGDLLRVGSEVDDDRLDELFDDAIDDDIDDDRYVAVHNTQLGFLSSAIYASDDGRVARLGRCADAPPGPAATEWRTRCGGEFGGGRANGGASTSDVVGPSGGTGSSGQRQQRAGCRPASLRRWAAAAAVAER